jgi:ElaA protein
VTPTLHQAAFADLDPATLYRILQLRSEVFVVEQNCVFLDQDGKDADPGTVHWWAEDSGAVVSYLRMLCLAGEAELGRVVTTPAGRGRGFAGTLVAQALAGCGRPVVIKAQARLAPWYMTFGFVITGPEFDEDGQPHIPMRLDG